MVVRESFQPGCCQGQEPTARQTGGSIPATGTVQGLNSGLRPRWGADGTGPQMVGLTSGGEAGSNQPCAPTRAGGAFGAAGAGLAKPRSKARFANWCEVRRPCPCSIGLRALVGQGPGLFSPDPDQFGNPQGVAGRPGVGRKPGVPGTDGKFGHPPQVLPQRQKLFWPLPRQV